MLNGCVGLSNLKLYRGRVCVENWTKFYELSLDQNHTCQHKTLKNISLNRYTNSNGVV